MKKKMFISSLIATMAVAIVGCGGGGSDDSSASTTSTITCSVHSLSFDKAASSTTVTVSSSKEWTIYSNQTWLTCSPNSSIKSSETVTVSASKNSDLVSRSGYLVVKSGLAHDTIRVTQSGDEATDIVPPAGYKLVWHDEFNDASLSGGKPAMPGSDWTYQTANPGWVNNELQYYVAGITSTGDTLASIKNGTLKLLTKKIDGKVYSVRLYGKQSTGWKYGYIEARMKLPKGKGTWPAFWMMPVNFNNDWPASGEMDIMEEVGYNPNVIVSSLHATNHYGSSPASGNTTCPTSQTAFHKYAMEWTSTKITFYLDDVAYYSYANSGKGSSDWPYTSAFYVILNMAWGGSWGGAQGVDESSLPTTYEIDYVRVFQK